MRRTFVTKMAQGGVSVQVAASVAGHSVRTMEKHYVNIANLKAHGALKGITYGQKDTQPHKEPHKKQA